MRSTVQRIVATTGIVLASVVLVMPSVALGSPPATPEQVSPDRYFPARSQLGDGWVTRNTLGPGDDLDESVFEDVQRRRYGGPAGARATVTVWTLTDRPGSTLRGWTLVTDQLERTAFSFEGGYASLGELASLDPPDGCLDAQRMSGVDDTGFSVSITLCATEAAFISSYFSGEMPYMSPIEASDQLIAWALEAAAA